MSRYRFSIKLFCSSILLLFSISICTAYAQKDNAISVDFKQSKISEVIIDLESKSSFHFYYDPKIMDSLSFTLKAENKSIVFVLDNLFKSVGVNYTIFKKDIFLTKNTQLVVQEITNNPVSQTVKNIVDLSQSVKVQQAVTPNKLYEIGMKTNELKNIPAILSGNLKEASTGKPIAGAVISSQSSNVQATTNQSGYYTIELLTGQNILDIKTPGREDTQRQVMLYGNGKLNIELKENILSLKEVEILANKVSNTKSVEMGVNRLDIKTIKKVPSLFGEPDILRVILTLPGVQTVGEASTGFNVRGGSTDQNLILLNDATIYNPSHFFGFFSAFNPDIVKDVELYKSTIPENYGGRLASVLEVTNRTGDKKKFTGSAGIGLITSRFNIEGPIDNGKTSFIFGGRVTYSNWLLKLLPKDYEQSKASFYDLNIGINHQLNEKNEINISGYYSKDDFKLNTDTSYNYSNQNGSIKWKHTFNEKLNVAFTAGFDAYDYSINSNSNPINAYKLGFKISQTNFKTDFRYKIGDKHQFKFGLSAIYYKLNPGSFVPVGNESLVTADILPAEQALESAIYVGDEFKVTEAFSINAGLRYSLYNYLGPQTINNYAPNLPVTEDNLLSTTQYGDKKVIDTYKGPEIRVSGRYNLTKDFSVKASYNTLRQYIHLLSNTTAIAPTDIWKLSDPNIKPQFGSQVSLGLYKNYSANTIETSVEVYYKKLKDYLDYKSGASLVLNHAIERDVVNTNGKAYGIEFLMKKNTGKLTGWMSYAYSRTMLRTEDLEQGSLVNEGSFYPANHDKPHAFNFTGNYAFKQRYHLSFNVTYSTGRPITLPIAKYYYAGSERVYYSDRNAYRIPDYFRTDISFNIEGNYKVNQRFRNSFTMGIYNVTGRKNAYSTYFTQENGVISGYKLSIFASMLPFVSYNIKF
ncbi:MAG: TonB-dependent receptor [Pedobacter sp.]|nr:MAG: TonB-dependent receptor [Pedobacter sp.]